MQIYFYLLQMFILLDNQRECLMVSVGYMDQKMTIKSTKFSTTLVLRLKAYAFILILIWSGRSLSEKH